MIHCLPDTFQRPIARAKRADPGSFWITALFAGCLAGVAWAGQPATSPASAPSAPAAVLLSPSLGRPVFVEPGSAFELRAQVADAAEPVTIRLFSNRAPGVSCPLPVPSNAVPSLAEGLPLLLRIPPDLPERTYDVELTTGVTRLFGRHCVAVKRLTRQIRIAHLSNMNIGDLSAPDFDWRLIADVNLVAPDLIVASGDFVSRMAENPASIWQRLPEFFSRFDAPAFIACGDHDNLEEYSRHVAANPIGTVELGFLRGFAIYDRPSRPISDDAGQQHWLEQNLAATSDQHLKFIVAHDDRPNLLLDWQKRGVLKDMISKTRFGLWLSGGQRDWDGVEYAEIVRAAAPLLYVRTHESSTATLDGAGGVSHFRVLDVSDERVSGPGWDPGARHLPPSLPAGLLTCVVEGPNDGTSNYLAVNMVNNHPLRIDGLQAHVLLAAGGEARPWCFGAELTAAQRIGEVWDCRLRFDLPDNGACRAIVGTGATPVLPAWTVRFDLPSALQVASQQTSEGLSYVTAGDVNAMIYITNSGATPADVTPLLRLDGDLLSYKLVEEAGPPVAAYELHIPPQRTVTLQPDLAALRVSPGRRELQVYLTGLPAWEPACQPLRIEIGK